MCQLHSQQACGACRSKHLTHTCLPARACLLPCSLWHNHRHSPLPALQRLREAALTALGLVVIGRPQLMLQNLQLNVLEGAVGAASAPAHSAGSGDAGSPPRRQLSAQGSGMMQGLLLGENVVKVYTSVLSEPDVPMAVKGRVLTNLVELLRWGHRQRCYSCSCECHTTPSAAASRKGSGVCLLACSPHHEFTDAHLVHVGQITDICNDKHRA